MKKLLFPLFFVGLIVASSTLIGCNKKEDTIAKILVRDANNDIISGVKVIIYGESSEPGKQGKVNIADTATSNSAGEAIFNLNYMYQAGQAGVAVLNLSANKPVPGGSSLTGSGIIKVVEELTNEETVFIQ
ncbi:MAG: hypothetical protein P8M61_01530 [Crocinitomicaceae bacterium]|jgi:hypothetical protein|nr:hypothetical protein [Crocinitomicaceae bacterium]